MNVKRWWRPKVALVSVTVLVAGVLTVLAVRSPGYEARAVDLSQRTVWVTNQTDLLVGRINKQIGELNSAVRTGAPFDVYQDGDDVLVMDGSRHELRPLDPASVTLGGKITLPNRAKVAFGGGVAAVADEDTGALWVGTPQQLSAAQPVAVPQTVDTGKDVAVATSVDGVVYAAAPGSATLWRIAPAADGAASSGSSSAATSAAPASQTATAPSSPAPDAADQSALPTVTKTDLAGGPLSKAAAASVDPAAELAGATGTVAVTSVGDVPVVLDRAAGAIILPGQRVEIPDAATAMLQQPGPAAAFVMVATKTALLRIPLPADGTDSAQPAAVKAETVIDGQNGAPAAPVYLDGCVHAAWSSSPARYGIACDGSKPGVRDIPGHAGTATMVFRVNRDVIVLNDVATGNAWLLDKDDLKLIDNWDDVRPESDQPDDKDQNSKNEGLSQQLASSKVDCTTTDIGASTVADDGYGVRAGRSTVLRVLDNDTPGDCAMLTITGVDGWDEGAAQSVSIVDGGQALQVTVPPDAAAGGLPTLSYRVSDGAGHTEIAHVAVHVVDGEGQPPVKLRDSTVPVEVLGTVSYNVLSDYYSPNGDDLFLLSASVADTSDEVSFLPDGVVTFSDKGVEGAVKKSVKFVVSDGVHQVPGKLTIDAVPEGTAEPIAAPVHLAAVTGRPTDVNILQSVVQPSVEPTRIVKVTPINKGNGVTATIADPASGRVDVTGAKAGTAYFAYEVAAGSKTADGVLRVDVSDPAKQNKPPQTMADVVYLPTGGVATIAPAANDYDPMAGAMALIGVDPDPLLTVSTEDMQLVTVSAQSALPASGAEIRYTVSNGGGVATGLIRVVPVPIADPVPPLASNIFATVRAGDALTIPIVNYALDPTGDVVRLTKLGTGTVPPGSGVLFNTESAIRYLAPAVAPKAPIHLSYTVANSKDVTASASATITVVPDGGTNHPPIQPKNVVARVLTDRTVQIALPLDGIDPDGDWVTLQSISSPSDHPLGMTEVSGMSTISYTAGDVPGFDTFKYTAADPYGETVTGVVSVLVVDPPTTVSAPVAPNLDVTVRPGQAIGIDVLSTAAKANLSQRIRLAASAFEAPAGWNVAVDPASQQLVLHAPTKDTIGAIKYTVDNESDLSGSGLVTVTVSATAALKPPTAQDIMIPADTIKTGQQSVDVEVPADKLTNPSGTVGDLKLSLDPESAGAATVSGSREFSIPLTKERQVLAYHATNSEGAVATAFVVVPPGSAIDENQPLTLDLSAAGPPLTVKAGESITVDIAQHVKATDGAKLEIPNGGQVSVTGGGDVGRVDATHFKYTAPKDGNGPVYVSFPVTDGVRTPVTASVTITVTPAESPAPVVQDISLTVEAGKTTTQDIANLVKAGDDELQKSLKYRLTGDAAGFSTSISGTVVTVDADLKAKGRSGTFTLTATDSQGKSGTGTISVRATASTEPLVKVTAITLDEGRPNQASQANIASAIIYNPFDTPPTLVTSSVQSGSGTAHASGLALTVTPNAVGTVVVSYTLQDATQDPDRQVSGTVTVTVKDKPDTPGTPTVVSMASHTVELKWTPPKDNGSPIAGYTVTAAGFSQACADTPCTLKGLKNGTEYRFAVAAANAIGTSEASTPSAPITPDTAPNTPSAPSLTWTAKVPSLQVNWSDPGSDGTPIDSYTLRISPSDKSGRTEMTVTGTSYTWSGLEFGQAYTFQVQAHNKSEFPSGWSPSSAPETPSTTPKAPTGVQVSFGPDNYSAGGNTLSVVWTAPSDDGGADLENYTVSYGGSPITVPAGQTATKIQGVADGTTYTVTVTATNRAGIGDVSNSSSAKPFSPPGVVSSVVATATGADGTINLTWAAAQAHGLTIAKYMIDWGGGSGEATGTSKAITGLKNGTTYNFNVKACYSDSEATFNTCGQSGSGTGIPYGPVATPTASDCGSSDTQVNFCWTVPPSNGRPPVTTQISIDGGGWSDNSSGSIWVGSKCEQSHSITVRAKDAEGHLSSGTASASGKSNSCPDPVVSASRGDSRDCGGAYAGSTCYYVVVSLSDFPPNSSGSCRPSWANWSDSVSVGSSGGAQYQTSNFWMGNFTGGGTVTCDVGGYSASGQAGPWK